MKVEGLYSFEVARNQLNNFFFTDGHVLLRIRPRQCLVKSPAVPFTTALTNTSEAKAHTHVSLLQKHKQNNTGVFWSSCVPKGKTVARRTKFETVLVFAQEMLALIYLSTRFSADGNTRIFPSWGGERLPPPTCLIDTISLLYCTSDSSVGNDASERLAAWAAYRWPGFLDSTGLQIHTQIMLGLRSVVPPSLAHIGCAKRRSISFHGALFQASQKAAKNFGSFLKSSCRRNKWSVRNSAERYQYSGGFGEATLNLCVTHHYLLWVLQTSCCAPLEIFNGLEQIKATLPLGWWVNEC